MALTQAGFRAAMAEFATGVTVVTTMHEGRPYGMTEIARRKPQGFTPGG